MRSTPVRARPATRGPALCAALAVVALSLTACADSPEPSATTTTPQVTAPAPSETAVTAPPLLDFPFGPSQSTTPLPDDCRAILTDRVLSELEGVPLNADGMGGGIRPDSSRVCAWGEPGAAATWLVTVIGFSPYRAATDALYELGRSGYTCYEPGDGVRCEITEEHETLPVTTGRTLYYRDGIIIDTQYSNLAPSGYTNAIVASLWPREGATRPTPTPTP